MDVPKIEFKKILYPTDLSEGSRYCFNFAASLANTYNAELTVIHVVDESLDIPKNLSGYMTEELWDEIKQRDLEEARKLMIERKRDNVAIRECVGQYCKEIQSATAEPYITYSIVVKAGNPVEVIVNEADTGDYDLLVIGRHGHGTLKDSVMGSIARRVLRRINTPTLLVPLPE
ncbi:MAG: universal stress protein [Desulfobulbaceae bacterium]|uniref:Universal stress protein n=1 Tax=Candidatus Desulfobia pelagia TaxID=2841692 RepID=A0A8J6TDA4_9BACT|nr:universal stress protein [Candidatus Desulfobia pelagia]